MKAWIFAENRMVLNKSVGLFVFYNAHGYFFNKENV